LEISQRGHQKLKDEQVDMCLLGKSVYTKEGY